MKSSGNVFKDLGLPDPELEYIKAQLAVVIYKIIESKNLTQTEMADLLDVDQPEISKLKNGQYYCFSLERLLHFLNRLHYNIDIKLSVARGERAHHRVVGGN